MTTIAQIRSEIATALAGVDGHVDPRKEANPGFPLHLIGDPDTVEHTRTAGGARAYTIPVTTYVALNDVDEAQTVRDGLVHAVADAINANASTIADIWTTQTVNFRPETLGNTKTIAFDTLVEAIG